MSHGKFTVILESHGNLTIIPLRVSLEGDVLTEDVEEEGRVDVPFRTRGPDGVAASIGARDPSQL